MICPVPLVIQLTLLGFSNVALNQAEKHFYFSNLESDEAGGREKPQRLWL